MAPLLPWLGEWGLAVVQHHERFDGTGYPHQLKGHEISLAARIVSVADVYEVMTAPRAYKRSMSVSAARRELVRVAGTQLDPVIVRAFLNISVGRLWRTIGFGAWIAQVPQLGRLFGLGGWTSSGLGMGIATATTATVLAVGGVIGPSPTPSVPSPGGLTGAVAVAPSHAPRTQPPALTSPGRPGVTGTAPATAAPSAAATPGPSVAATSQPGADTGARDRSHTRPEAHARPDARGHPDAHTHPRPDAGPMELRAVHQHVSQLHQRLLGQQQQVVHHVLHRQQQLGVHVALFREQQQGVRHVLPGKQQQGLSVVLQDLSHHGVAERTTGATRAIGGPAGGRVVTTGADVRALAVTSQGAEGVVSPPRDGRFATPTPC